MGIDELKRWHWVVVGLLVGLLLAVTRTSMEPPRGPRSTKALQFESQLMASPLKSGEPMVANVVVYPPVVTGAGKVYPVHFDQLTPTADRKGWTYKPWYLDAETPYVSKLDPAEDSSKETIVTFLERAAKNNPNVKFRYAWWAETPWQYALWTVGGVVVIGGAWPTVLNVLVGAGFGPKKKEEKYDLERFGKYKEDEKGGEKKVVTDADQAKVDEVAAKIEADLGGFGVKTDGAGVPVGAAAAAEGAARKLDGGPMEEVVINKEDEEKDYKGEFYPVARPHGHKHDEPGHGGH